VSTFATVESSRSSSGGSSADPYAAAWRLVEAAVLRSPGALTAAEREAIVRGEDPAEVSALLMKVRARAYTIVDADVEGVALDVVVESVLSAALAEADARRRAALEAIG
jgi:hypothetical protein